MLFQICHVRSQFPFTQNAPGAITVRRPVQPIGEFGNGLPSGIIFPIRPRSFGNFSILYRMKWRRHACLQRYTVANRQIAKIASSPPF